MKKYNLQFLPLRELSSSCGNKLYMQLMGLFFVDYEISRLAPDKMRMTLVAATY